MATRGELSRDDAVTSAAVTPRVVERTRAIARVLDSAVRIPGTPVRFGLDAVIGLVPGFGDVLGGVLSGYIMLLAARAGAPASVLLRMAGNVGVDAIVGTVPLLGDAFDVGWKSNTRNVRLLEQHLGRPTEARRSSRWVVALLLLVVALVLVGAAALGVAVVRLLAGMVRGGFG